MEKQQFKNKQLFTLIWPLVIEQGLAILVGMADTVMVSSAGEAAISGVSLVDMINNLVFTIFAGLATGGAVVTSQAIGAKDVDRVKRSVGQLVNLATLIGLGVMLFCLALRRPMLRLFFGSISDDVMAACMLYFSITLLSYPFLALYNSGAAIFRSLGNSAVSMKVSIAMNLINFFGNALCIYGLKMGVAGVALPTAVSRIFGAITILFLASKIDGPARITLKSVLSFDSPMAGKILTIGTPSAFENSVFQLGRVLVVSMISAFGTVHISANAVANSLDSIGCIFGQAISLAMITVVGQCVGAQDIAAAKNYTKKLIAVAYVAMAITNGLILIFLNPLLSMFSLSPETNRLSWILVMIHAGFAIFMWPASFVLPNALRAANDVRFTMITSIASMIIWRISFSLVLCNHMGLGAIGVWIAMIIDWICRIICFVWRFNWLFAKPSRILPNTYDE